LAKETKVHNYGLMAGIIICGLGFGILLNSSWNDFLTPGFMESGILTSAQIPAQESMSNVLHVNEVNKPITLLISHQNSPVAFNIKIENSQGTIIYNANVVKSSVTFVPDISGDYLVSIKNLSGKEALVNVSYGYTQTSENITLFSFLWVFLILGGNYLIIHTYFSGTRNRSYFTH